MGRFLEQCERPEPVVPVAEPVVEPVAAVEAVPEVVPEPVVEPAPKKKGGRKKKAE